MNQTNKKLQKLIFTYRKERYVRENKSKWQQEVFDLVFPNIFPGVESNLE